jgi:uncharacterized membrane protein
MPDIGFYHPLVIHFVIALLIVGVTFRWGSFTTFIPFASGAAVALIVLGTLAAVVAVRSGEDASVFAEALPGTASAVASHARRATVARNVFLVVAGLEVAALCATRTPTRANRRPSLARRDPGPGCHAGRSDSGRGGASCRSPGASGSDGGCLQGISSRRL